MSEPQTCPLKRWDHDLGDGTKEVISGPCEGAGCAWWTAVGCAIAGIGAVLYLLRGDRQ